MESERHLNVSGLYSPEARRRSRRSMVEERDSISVVREELVLVRVEREAISARRKRAKKTSG